MSRTLQELAEYVGGRVAGDPETRIERVAGIEEATSHDITFVANPKYLRKLRETKAGAVIVSDRVSEAPCPRLVCGNPYLAFARIVELLMYTPRRHVPGVHPGAQVAAGAQVDPSAVVYAGASLADGVKVGPRAVIHPNAVLEPDCSVGEETEICAGAVLCRGTQVGARCVIHPNVVLGASGFGFAPDGRKWYPIRQVGVCVVEDEVSIGANTTICRGALGRTVIRRGTKIDSNCVISHNCDIGEDCLIISLVGVSGTVTIGNHCTLAGQAGIAGHLKIGDDATIGGQAGVTSDLAGGAIYLGSPAIPADKARRGYVLFERLPEMLQRIVELEAQVRKLTGGGSS